MGLLDYISQIGGLLGLFIGFSVISAIEIVYWITFRFARNKLSTKPTNKIENHANSATNESVTVLEEPVLENI